MTALQVIIKEAKAIRKKSPKIEWKKAVAQASAIYASKHKGKSPVGKKKAVKKAAKKKAVGKVDKKLAKGLASKGLKMPHGYDVVKRKRKIGAVKKSATTMHKDTKSHNVNIRVMSGTGKKMLVRISPVGYVYASNFVTKNTMGMREWLKNNIGKWIEIDTQHLFNNQYNTVNHYRIYDTMIDAIQNDVRKKGKPYGVSDVPEEIAFLDWGGVKPTILPNIPEKKFGSYYFESHSSLNYHRLWNARQTINFIYSNGKYWISNGIGYKSHNKISSTYSGNTIPAKVKNDLDKYLKMYY